MKKSSLVFFAFILFLMINTGCLNSGEVERENQFRSQNNEEHQVALLVTADFGSEIISQGDYTLKNGMSVMDILLEDHEVETSYGGGFVNAIDGLVSGYTGGVGDNRQKMDWFYYVNGVQANVGCSEYFPQPGDVIWWDYHDWNNAMFVPAVVGCYPEPFLGGYEHKTAGTLIMYQPGYESSAEKIKSSLGKYDVQNIQLEIWDTGKILSREVPTIVTGVWNYIGNDANIKKIMENKSKTGIFVDLSATEFTALNPARDSIQSFTEHPGAVIATGTGSGDTAPLWIVTATDDTGLNRAVTLLTEETDKIKGRFGLIVEGEKLVNVPFIE